MRWHRLAIVLTSAACVGAATLLSRAAGASAITAGFAYVLVVLAMSSWRGLLAGATASIAATLAFNFFFLPPIGTFRIAEPQNWVSLGAFALATILASRLLARERRRAEEAEARKREIEALYALCVDLFTAGTSPGGLSEATGRALRTIGARAGGLHLRPRGESSAAAWIGRAGDREIHDLLERVPRGASPETRERGPWRDVRIPLTAAGHEVGELVAYGTRAKHETLESVARLVALALERETLLEERAQLDALQARDALRTALLRAVSHDLSTPLTAMLLQVESLRRSVASDAAATRAVDQVAEQASRLHRRIENLLAMARIEAGGVTPRREPTPAADLFRAVRESQPLLVATHPIDVRVAEDCPDLDVDPSLVLEILVNLVENARRAAPPGSSIELVATPLEDDASMVALEVLDRGPGPRAETEPSSADADRRGLGLEIARSFALASGGRVELSVRERGGARARVELPAARAAEAAPVPT